MTPSTRIYARRQREQPTANLYKGRFGLLILAHIDVEFLEKGGNFLLHF